MQIIKAYKYRIYPNKQQQEQISKTFGCVRFVYNYYLNKKIKMYESMQKSLSKIDCNNHLNRELKLEFLWLKDIDKFALTNSVYNLDSAYQKFFREHTGFPKFKSKRETHRSYTTNCNYNKDGTPQNIKVDNNRIQLPKLGKVKAKISRLFIGKIKSATISKTSTGKYYVSLCIETNVEPLPKSNKQIGLDLGLKTYYTDSDNNDKDNPKFYREAEKKLIKAQRKLSRKLKGSNNRNKARLQVAKLHEKIVNQRHDFLHKLSTNLINENQVISIEDLNVKGMMRNHKLAKGIMDVAWGEFCRQLKYKSEWYGRDLKEIDRYYASSQICNHCGYKNADVKNLKVRQWECPDCGNHNDRDYNAAKNIRDKGLGIAI